MTFLELRLAFAEIVQVPDVIRSAPSMFSFAQDTLEKAFLLPSMETTVSATVKQNVNVIPIPVDYLELIYMQMVNGTVYRMLNKFSERDFAEWSIQKRISITWTPNTVMPLGYFIIPATQTASTLLLAYEVTTAGTSGVTEPTWPTNTATAVTLNGVTYTSTTLLNPSFPSSYTREGSSWILNYPADAAYLYNVRYFAKLTKLSADSDTNWWSLNVPELLLYGAVVKAIPMLGDDPRSGVWKSNYDALRAELKTALGRERYSGKKLQTSVDLNIYHTR